jgi:hypothetical protein
LLLSTDENKNELDNIFNKLNQTNNKTERKQLLQQIMNLALKMKNNWEIDDETLQMIKSDICSLLNYYEIPSDACWTTVKNDVKVESTSIISRIIKIVLIILWIVFVVFVVIIAIFVVKAKRERETENNE